MSVRARERDYVASTSGGGVGPAPELGQARDAGGKAPNDAVSIRVIPLTATKRSGCSTISFSRRKLVRNQLDLLAIQRRIRASVLSTKYIRDSGDTSVRPKQITRETQEAVHRLASLLVPIGRNLHEGFHAICPPNGERIATETEQ